jgi:thioredoxin reductase
LVNIAIVGAGPYGLSIAAHLRRYGVPFRIFGRPMDTWLEHMPKGMLLKSEGFASIICDAGGEFTLKRFCAERHIDYADEALPVRLDTFSAYGLAFQQRMVSQLENKLVTVLERASGGFQLTLDNGEMFVARQVILAVGITHFSYIPPEFRNLPTKFLSHSFEHHDLERFHGRNVAVIGGGASALDLAALLHETGAEVQLVARTSSLSFHSKPDGVGSSRSLWKRLRHPKSGLGPGLRSRIFTETPRLFRYLPARLRTRIVSTHLGPSGGWFTKDAVIGKVPIYLGCTPLGAEVRNDRISLYLRDAHGNTREIETEHVITATGYRPDINRLHFVSPQIRANLRTIENAPALKSNFESSEPGLYFVGAAAANTFGPLMRFAYGAGYTAHRITRSLLKSQSRERSMITSPAMAPLPVRRVDE